MMANPQRGEVAIRIDGREHVMRLTLGALAELEDRLKVTSLLGLAEKFETGGVASGNRNSGNTRWKRKTILNTILTTCITTL